MVLVVVVVLMDFDKGVMEAVKRKVWVGKKDELEERERRRSKRCRNTARSAKYCRQVYSRYSSEE